MLPQDAAEQMLYDAALCVYRLGYQPVYIAIHGSQNYGLDTPQSDFDYQCVVVPTLNDLIQNKLISTTLEYRGGLIEVKDIREQVKCMVKMNPTYLETFLTSYAIKLCDVPQIDQIKGMIPQLLKERGKPYMEALNGIFTRYVTQTMLNNGKDYDSKAGYQAYRMMCMMRFYMGRQAFLMRVNDAEAEAIMKIKNHQEDAKTVSIIMAILQQIVRRMMDEARRKLPDPSYETANKMKELAGDMITSFIVGNKKIIMQED